MASDGRRLAAAEREKDAGDAAYLARSLQEAVQRYSRAANLDPSDVSLLNRRAAAYFQMAKYEECVKDCDAAVKKGRELKADREMIALALSRKGVALLETAVSAGDYELAIGALQQSLDEHDSRTTLRKMEIALGALEELRRLDQKAANRHREEGNGLLRQKKFQEAEDCYTKAIKMNSNDPRGYVGKAKVRFLVKNYEGALETYIEGLKCDANNVEVLEGLRRCAAFINKANGGIVGPKDLEEMLDDDLLNKLQKSMEEAEVFKKEASEELLRQIESERMAVQRQKETEESLSRVEQELEQLKIQKDEVAEELQKANDHNEHLQSQLSESRELYDWLLSENQRLLHERDCAVQEAEELRQKRGQIRPLLVTAMSCEFSSSELERATENFSSSLKIGEDGFGCIYRGVLRNKTFAIKVLRPDILQAQSQFEQEVSILSRVRHPNLVTLIGACSEPCTLVYEFLPNGSLEDFLVCADKRQTLVWQIRVRIIAEICSALIFLHKSKPHPVVHGDLKPANILLDVNLVSKLSDFGISRLLIHSSSNNTTLYRTIHPAGTPLYMDPEFFATGELTTQSDVYSFGIVVLLLLTGRPPIGIKKLVEDAMEEGNLRSVIDTSAGEWPDVHVYQLAHLALQCTELSRRCRPDLSDEVWGAVEAMRDAAAASLPSSSRSVMNENCTPSYFICPISQDVMNDPHIAADGFTYEAEAIRSWLGTGSVTSPMTNLPLQHDKLIPNHALRSAIQEWLQHQNIAL